MASEKTITIEISPTGEVSFTVNGVKGTSCVAETKFLEDALGGKVLSREETSEYYENQVGETVGNYGKT
jgi:hypothetical protein